MAIDYNFRASEIRKFKSEQPFRAWRNGKPVQWAKETPIKRKISKRKIATKVAGRLGKRAFPIIGAVAGAREIKRNIPKLYKGIPKLIKERRAASASERGLSKMRTKMRRRLK